MSGSDKIFKTLIWSNLEGDDKKLSEGQSHPCDPNLTTSNYEACVNHLNDDGDMLNKLQEKLSTTLNNIKTAYDEEDDVNKIQQLITRISNSKVSTNDLGDLSLDDIVFPSPPPPRNSLPGKHSEYELHSRKINIDSVLWGVVSLTFLYFTIKKIRTIGS